MMTRRISQWVIGGMVAVLLWTPLVGAEDGSQRVQDHWRFGRRESRQRDPVQLAPVEQNARGYHGGDRAAQRPERREVWRDSSPNRWHGWNSTSVQDGRDILPGENDMRRHREGPHDDWGRGWWHHRRHHHHHW